MGKRKWHDYTEQSGGHRRRLKKPAGDDDDINSATSLTHRPNIDSNGLPTSTATNIDSAVQHAIRVLEPPNDLNLEQRKRWRQLTRAAAASVTTHGTKPAVQSAGRGESDEAENVSNIQGNLTLDPPPGLSKAQRKRWRKRMRNVPGNVNVDNLDPTAQPGLRKEEEQQASSALADTNLTTQPSLLKQLSTTKLQSEARKQWPDQGRQQSLAARQSPSPAASPVAEESSRGSSRDAAYRTSSESPKEDSRQVVEHSQSTEARITLEGVKTSPSLAAPLAKPKVETHVELQRSGGNFRSLSLRNTPVTMSFRRSSFGRKATNVPPYSGDESVEKSFKRFSAFLRGRDADSSDEDSDESEDDSDSERSEVDDADLPPIIVNGNTPEQVNSSPKQVEVLPYDQQEPDHYSTDIRTIVSKNDMAPQSRYEGDEPSSSSQPELRTSSAVRANVGIKRQLSFLEHGLGGNYSGAGASAEPTKSSNTDATMPLNRSVAFDVSDDDFEDVLQTVDEVSRNLFTATRPLPASKPPHSPDPNRKDLEDGLLTSPSSDRRVTRSMLTPKNTPKHDKWSGFLVSAPVSIVCNSVHVPEFDVSGKSPPKQHVLSQTVEALQESDDNINVASKVLEREASSSSLSELTRSPSPPIELAATTAELGPGVLNEGDHGGTEVITEKKAEEPARPNKPKRKMTGSTSKHFQPEKRRSSRQLPSDKSKNEPANDLTTEIAAENIPNPEIEAHPETPVKLPAVSESTRLSTRKRKGTGKKSSYFTPSKPPLDPNIIDRVDFYNTTGKNKRGPAGVSTAPVPPITSARFGIIQEKLWQEPFWLLIAVTFLNQTTGRAAAPVFWDLKRRYSTPEALAEADQKDLCDLITHLGLQRQRSRRIIAMAQAWVESPPVKGRRWRCLHYPARGDGKHFKQNEVVGEDADDCAGALEIGHIPGCGPYAWDSWRIFCRDVLRGVAEDYNGLNPSAVGSGRDGGGDGEFVPEWRKVLPLDKELRACLRWMWLRDGWIWDCESGERRAATEEEMELAVLGEMEVADEKEGKFAALAAGVEVENRRGGKMLEGGEQEQGQSLVEEEEEDSTATPVKRQREGIPADAQSEDSASDNIVVSSATKTISSASKRVRRSARLST